MTKPALPEREIKSGVAHLRSLTGWRFIAAFVVFVSHIQHFLFPAARNLPLGGPAVSFFFVLSGFILTYVYQDRLGWKGVPRFLVSRWARLWPLHIVCLAIAVGLMFMTYFNQSQGRNSWASLAAQVLMLHSWLPINSWFTDFNAVSWSISTELFFYCLFPLLLLVGGTRYFWFKLILVTVAVFSSLVGFQAILNSQPPPTWLNPVTVAIPFPVVRLLEFVVGMATCLLMRRLRIEFRNRTSTGWLGYMIDSIWELSAVLAIVISWILVVESRLWNTIYSAPEIGQVIGIWFRVAGGMLFYAFLIFVFASRHGVLGQIMSSRLMVWLGEISFAFYLIHQVVIVQLHRTALDDVTFSLLAILMSVLAASLLYRIVELPCRDGIMKWFDGKADWRTAATAGMRSTVRSPAGLLQIVALGGTILFLVSRPVDEITIQACQEIALQTPGDLRNVLFDDEALLLGMQAERVERGVLLRMAWDRKRSWSRSRFLHFCDARGNIIRQGPLQKKAFAAAAPNRPFIDQVLLHKRSLKGVDYVAVGFWSERDACAVVGNRDGEMNDCRMRLFRVEDIK